jgi:glycosyltransferase involved in cell wall biosynthesis/GT2 family glycosyltransferase
MNASIVINTYNRGGSLARTLHSLQYLRGAEFEVIVVNGPSQDDTEKVLDAFRARLKRGRCGSVNISISRNAGVRAAAGDVVAFLDDDAVPDPKWLQELLRAYDAEDVGGAGGLVWDHTGTALQYKYSYCDRRGIPGWDGERPLTAAAFPGCRRIPYLQGTNASFRRTLLVELGSFDEEYEYGYDEVDVCARIVDAGYRLVQLPSAFMYHYSLPSPIRNEKRVVYNHLSMLKSKGYFSLVNSDASPSEVYRELQRRADEIKKELQWHRARGNVGGGALNRLYADLESAYATAVAAAQRGRRLEGTPIALKLRGPVTECTPRDFTPFPTLQPTGGLLNVCLVSQEYPPDRFGGIGRMTKELATGMAEAGHSVHVISRSADRNTIEYEDGVWVHRIMDSPDRDSRNLPGLLWGRSVAVLREIEQIHNRTRVDIVDSPIWDAEGLATILDGRFTTVISLETPLAVAIRTNPGWVDGTEAQQQSFAAGMRGEQEAMRSAGAIRAISAAVVETVAKEYRVADFRRRCGVVHLGVGKPPVVRNAATPDETVILFVGRFESRKGIDELLEAAPPLLDRYPLLHLRLVGSDIERVKNGRTRTEHFQALHSGENWLSRVHFLGPIPDAQLEQEYANCSMLAAPSLYESFGLVLVEAMRYGKPQVASAVGGIKEIVIDAETGLLVPPGNAEELRRALDRLIADRGYRLAMGRSAYARYEQYFTREKMTKRTVSFYRTVLQECATGRG